MKTAQKDISVIIPCFNTQPLFLQEAINSVKEYKGKYSYDIIVVDDGSTNESTLNYLKNVHDETIQLVTQENRGLAGARNTGIRNSSSIYLLFLDSDDRIKTGYIEEGIKLLEKNSKAGVVYSSAEAFGDSSRANFEALPFDITFLLLQNYIPSCVVMRRKAWEDAGGFDENLRRFEDWEFWVSIYKAGWKFEFINKPMFDYRIQKNSLLGASNETDFKNAIEYIYKKHWDLLYRLYHELYSNRIIYKNDMNRPLRSFIKYAKKNILIKDAQSFRNYP